MGNCVRIQWVDCLKGLAILWLVIYHFYVFNWLRSPVPLFFFLSGLFFSEGSTFLLFLYKKMRALLLPFLFFCVIGWSASFMKAHFVDKEQWELAGINNLFTLIPVTAEKHNPLGVGAIWFLVSLFEVYMLYYATRKISKNRVWLIVFSITCFLLSSLLMEKFAMGSLCYFLYSLGFMIYFVIAHVFRDFFLNGKFSFLHVLIFLSMYLVTFISLDNLETHEWGGVLLRIKNLISSMGLCLSLVWLVKGMENVSSTPLKTIILYEGRNSLTILGIHMLAITTISVALNHFMHKNIFYYVVLFFAVVAICNLCVWVFNRYLPFLVNHK